MDSFHKERYYQYYSMIYNAYLYIKILLIIWVPWKFSNELFLNLSIFYLFACIAVVIKGLDICLWNILVIPLYLGTVIGMGVSLYMVVSERKRFCIFPLIVYILDVLFRIYMFVNGGIPSIYELFGFIFALTGVIISLLLGLTIKKMHDSNKGDDKSCVE